MSRLPAMNSRLCCVRRSSALRSSWIPKMMSRPPTTMTTGPRSFNVSRTLSGGEVRNRPPRGLVSPHGVAQPPGPLVGVHVSQDRKRPRTAAALVRRGTSLSRGFTGGKCLHIGRGQRRAAHPPVPALDFFDDHPGHRAHGFPFDGNHRVGELPDDLALLRLREDAFNYFDLNQGHEGLLGELGIPRLMTQRGRGPAADTQPSERRHAGPGCCNGSYVTLPASSERGPAAGTTACNG